MILNYLIYFPPSLNFYYSFFNLVSLILLKLIIVSVLLLNIKFNANNLKIPLYEELLTF